MTTTLHRGGRIFTADPDRPWAEALDDISGGAMPARHGTD